MPETAKVCDLGAGTGNYILALSDTRPNASFVHVDFDEKMNESALRKYQQAAIKDVEIVTEYVQNCSFQDNEFDLIMCVNALYAISPQGEILKRARRWLKPNGRIFLIDFGRKQRTLDWTIYLFRESMKNHQAGEYVKALINSREVLKQNRKTSKGQDTGRYWLHTTSEFGDALEACGFQVDELYACYRGYADLAVCRKGDG
jgi:ubiquinone/menaquinone biosynthesis C-methylase UbiE